MQHSLQHVSLTLSQVFKTIQLVGFSLHVIICAHLVLYEAKDLTLKAKAQAKDLTIRSKAKNLILKVKTNDMIPEAKARAIENT